jgi:hypothetical protein
MFLLGAVAAKREPCIANAKPADHHGHARMPGRTRPIERVRTPRIVAKCREKGGFCNPRPARPLQWLRRMIDRVITYLKHHGVAFRFMSFPMPEPGPSVAFTSRFTTQLVQTRVVLVGNRPVLLCAPEQKRIDLPHLGQQVGQLVTEGSVSDLPAPWNEAAEPVPGFGGLFGVPVFMDETVARSVIVFRAFAREDFVQLAFDEFARIEQPRVVASGIVRQLRS